MKIKAKFHLLWLPQMNNLALQSLTESIAIKYFGKAFKHEVYYNKRLRTTGGRYILSSHNIEINPKQYEMFGEKAVIDIIKHELCHYSSFSW